MLLSRPLTTPKVLGGEAWAEKRCPLPPNGIRWPTTTIYQPDPPTRKLARMYGM
jgi:hypothetical protein